MKTSNDTQICSPVYEFGSAGGNVETLIAGNGNHKQKFGNSLGRTMTSAMPKAEYLNESVNENMRSYFAPRDQNPPRGNLPLALSLGFSASSYHSGETLYLRAETSRVYFLKKGCVKIMLNHGLQRGRTPHPKFIKRIVGPGEYFGFEAYAGIKLQLPSPEMEAAQVIQNAEIIAVDLAKLGTADLESWLMRDLLGQMLKWQIETEKHNREDYLASVHERIALQILRLVEKFGNPTKEGVSLFLKLSRNELAQLSGTINESLSRHLTELKEQGILGLRGKEILVKDQNALKRISSPQANETSSEEASVAGTPVESHAV